MGFFIENCHHIHDISIHCIILGHKDSVTCVGFSHDDSLLATGDMSGVIKVWKVDLREEIWSSEVGDLEVKTRNMSLQVSAVKSIRQTTENS